MRVETNKHQECECHVRLRTGNWGIVITPLYCGFDSIPESSPCAPRSFSSPGAAVGAIGMRDDKRKEEKAEEHLDFTPSTHLDFRKENLTIWITDDVRDKEAILQAESEDMFERWAVSLSTVKNKALEGSGRAF